MINIDIFFRRGGDESRRNQDSDQQRQKDGRHDKNLPVG